MDFELNRIYGSRGTNGNLWYGDQQICHTIELPWKKNEPYLSCIPEGRYLLAKRKTAARGDHLILHSVPGRSYILIHPANNARKELQGCIAPVMELAGLGKGLLSKEAFNRLMITFEEAQKEKNHVYIIIQKEKKMNLINRVQQPTPNFFKKLRTIGLILAAAGGAILGAPIALPVGIVTFAGYLTVGATVLTAVSQVTVEDQAKMSAIPKIKNKGDAGAW